MCLHAAGTLFKYLPTIDRRHPHDDEVTLQLFLAAFASFEFLGGNMASGLGLSHALGYALGAPYGISHGEPSCLTLGHVVKLKAAGRAEDAEQIARLLPYIHHNPLLDEARHHLHDSHATNVRDAVRVGDEILGLIEGLGLKRSLSSYGVGKDQVGIITQRATGSKVGGSVANVSPDVYQEVARLVSSLF